MCGVIFFFLYELYLDICLHIVLKVLIKLENIGFLCTIYKKKTFLEFFLEIRGFLVSSLTHNYMDRIILEFGQHYCVDHLYIKYSLLILF